MVKDYLASSKFRLSEFFLLVALVLFSLDHGGTDFSFLAMAGLCLVISAGLILNVDIPGFTIGPVSGRLLWAGLGFLSWAGLSLFWSVDRFVSTYELSKLGFYLLVFFVFVQAGQHLKDFRILRWYPCWAALLCLYGIFQYLGFWGSINLPVGQRAHSVFINPTAFATYLLAISPFFLGFLWKTKSALTRLYMGTVLFLCLVCLLCSLSRTAWLVCFLQGCLFLFLFRKEFSLKRGWKILLIFLCMTGVVLLHNLLFMQGSLLKRLEGFGFLGYSRNIQERLLMWAAALRLIALHPFLGTGLGTFHLVYPGVKDVRLSHYTQFYAHNDYLQLASELGVIGLLWYLFLIAAYLRLICFYLKAEGGDFRGLVLMKMALIGGAGVWLQGLWDFPFYQPVLMAVVFSYVGLGFSGTLRLKASGLPVVQPRPCKRRWLILTGWGLLGVLTLCILRAYLGQHHALKAQRLLARQQYLESIGEFQRAVRFLPYCSNYHINLGTAYYKYYTVRGEKVLWDKAVFSLQRAIETSPYQAYAYAFLGNVLRLGPQGKYREQALAYSTKAVALDPYHTEYRKGLALVYFDLGRFSDAYQILSPLKKEGKFDIPGRLQLAGVLFRLGRNPEAKEELEGILQQDPLQPVAREFLKRLSSGN